MSKPGPKEAGYELTLHPQRLDEPVETHIRNAYKYDDTLLGCFAYVEPGDRRVLIPWANIKSVTIKGIPPSE